MQPHATPGPPPVADPDRRRRTLIVVVMVAALLAGLLLLAGGAVAYLVHRANTKVDALPPACETIRPLVPELGPYELRDTQYHRACELWLPEDHPSYVKAWKILVGFYAEVDDGGPPAPAGVPEMMREVAQRAEPVPGLGDEAYRWDRDLYVRVGARMMVIKVMPNPVSSEAQVTDFATALVAELDS